MDAAAGDGEVLAGAAVVLSGRRAIDTGIAELILDPFDQEAADRVRSAQQRTAPAHRALAARLAATSLDPFNDRGAASTTAGADPAAGSPPSAAPPATSDGGS